MENAGPRTSASVAKAMAPAAQVWQRLAWVFLFASAMGLLEAICVIYLRRLIIPAGTGASSPVAPLARFPIEHIREACTLIMLLAVAWIAGFNWKSRVASFFFMFGAWDISYYVGLKWLAGWPASWLEWDCLFLIPKPWYGPVLAPVLISGYFMLASSLLLAGESLTARVRLSVSAILLQLLAFAAWYWSFVKDSDRIAAQGYSGVTYSWPLFACGLVIGVLGLRLATRPQRVSASVSSKESRQKIKQ